MPKPDMDKLSKAGFEVVEQLHDEGFNPGECMTILAVSIAVIASRTDKATPKDISRGFAMIIALASESYTNVTGKPCEVTVADLEFAKNQQSDSVHVH